MSKLHVKKGDNVLVISGKNKGAKGNIIKTFPKDGRILVEGVNIATKHKKPRGAGQAGGRIQMEAPFDASNVMLVCGKCNKATRVAHQIQDGKSVRICKKCGAAIQ